jgi:imidazolonepropionase-like amidohydrolase
VAATNNAAAALNLEATKGRIGENLDADLLVLSLNPLSGIDNLKSVYMVIKGGRIYQNNR